jgi:hypothetical protein
MIRYTGVEELELTPGERRSLKATIETYALHTLRRVARQELYVHIKQYERGDVKKRSRFVVLIRIVHHGRIISSRANAWDVREAVHTAFGIIEDKLYSHPPRAQLYNHLLVPHTH